MRAFARQVRIFRLRLLRRLLGIEVVNRWVARPGTGSVQVLRAFGATVGDAPTIYGQMVLHNAHGNYRRLRIGNRVHVGRGVFFDLSDDLTIEDDVTVSMGCTILTHQDIGERPLAQLYPRVLKPTTIGAGAYLGANVTVLCGCDIGAGSVIGAGAVVVKPIPAGVVAVGVPARIVRRQQSTDGSEERQRSS